MYCVPKEEQEIVINAVRTDDFAVVYVTDRTWMTRLDKNVKENPEEFKIKENHYADGSLVGRTYVFPKKYISIRKKQRVASLSEEQKQLRAERMRNIHRKKHVNEAD